MVPRAWEEWLHRMDMHDARFCSMLLDAAGGWTRSAQCGHGCEVSGSTRHVCARVGQANVMQRSVVGGAQHMQMAMQ